MRPTTPAHPTRPAAPTAVHVWLSALLGLALVLLAGCTSAGSTVVVPATGVTLPEGLDIAAIDSVVIAAGATANTPAPQLSPMTATALDEALARSLPVHVVTVQGTPSVADEVTFRALGGTEAGNRQVTRSNLRKVASAIVTQPTSDGADYLGALLLAADKARASGGRHPLVVLIGSGLSDTGAWDLTVPGMLGADAAEVVAALGADYPPDRLAGVDVLLSGIGWTTAPQEPLSDAQRNAERALWSGVVTALGGRVFVDVEPFTAGPVTTSHTVRPVELVEPAAPVVACAAQEIVLDQTSAVSFVANSTDLVDPTAAAGALDALARRLLDDPTTTAVVRGTTANVGDPAAQTELGLARARAIVDRLVGAGVPASQFTEVVGVGSDFPEYVMPDRDASGALLPGAASLNRSVRITLTDHC